MADQDMGGNSQPGTSEATPPHVDDSPEMVNQPSPPEEQRASSPSTSEATPAQVDDSPEMVNQPSQPEEQRVSLPSTSEATPAPVGGSPEMVNQPSPPEEQRVSSSSDQQPPEVADSPEDPSVSSTVNLESNDQPPVRIQQRPHSESPTLLGLLLSRDPLPISNQQRHLDIENALRDALSTSAGVAEPIAASAPASAEKKATASADEGSSQVIPKKKMEKKLPMFDYSNLQFDVDDSSSGSKSSPENIDSSPAGSDFQDETKEMESNATESAGLERDLSPGIDITIKESFKISRKEAVGLENHPSPSKIVSVTQATKSDNTETAGLSESSSATTTSRTEASGSGDPTLFVSSEHSSSTTSSIQVSGSGIPKTVGLGESRSTSISSMEDSVSGNIEAIRHSEPTTATTSIQVSGSEAIETGGSKHGTSKAKSGSSTLETPDKKEKTISPKRKSPAKVEHLEPKRYAPCSPDKRQSDSQMSTDLKDLHIKEADNTENKESTSREDEISVEILVTCESENMEVQEAEDDRTEDGSKDTKNDTEKMEESE